MGLAVAGVFESEQGGVDRLNLRWTQWVILNRLSPSTLAKSDWPTNETSGTYVNLLSLTSLLCRRGYNKEEESKSSGCVNNHTTKNPMKPPLISVPCHVHRGWPTNDSEAWMGHAPVMTSSDELINRRVLSAPVTVSSPVNSWKEIKRRAESGPEDNHERYDTIISTQWSDSQMSPCSWSGFACAWERGSSDKLRTVIWADTETETSAWLGSIRARWADVGFSPQWSVKPRPFSTEFYKRIMEEATEGGRRRWRWMGRTAMARQINDVDMWRSWVVAVALGIRSLHRRVPWGRDIESKGLWPWEVFGSHATKPESTTERADRDPQTSHRKWCMWVLLPFDVRLIGISFFFFIVNKFYQKLSNPKFY